MTTASSGELLCFPQFSNFASFTRISDISARRPHTRRLSDLISRGLCRRLHWMSRRKLASSPIQC